MEGPIPLFSKGTSYRKTYVLVHDLAPVEFSIGFAICFRGIMIELWRLQTVRPPVSIAMHKLQKLQKIQRLGEKSLPFYGALTLRA